MTINVNNADGIGYHGQMYDLGGDNELWIGAGVGAPTHSAPIGSYYFRTDGKRYSQNGPADDDWVLSKWADGTGFIISFPIIKDSSKSFLEISTASYYAMLIIPFQGTDKISAANYFSTIIGRSTSSNSDEGFDFRIYDATNSLVIAEKTQIYSNTKQSYDLGTISNLSSGSAIWELQTRVTPASPKASELFAFNFFGV